jgi:type 1 fimbriae regulatory protein FimE
MQGQHGHFLLFAAIAGEWGCTPDSPKIPWAIFRSFLARTFRFLPLLRKVKAPAMSRHAPSSPSGTPAPTLENRKVPGRRKNAEYRQREYLSEQEVEQVIKAAADLGRHGARDAALVLLAYRHGLRVSELVALRWDQVDLAQGQLHVARRKHGMPSVHPLRGPELRALRRLQRDYPETPYVFVSERQAPLTPDAVRKIVARAGRHAGLAFSIHPHMLRHATGYKGF